MLLVEDTRPLAELTRAALHDAGFAVDHAATFAEAFASVAAQAPDVIVLDLGPGIPDAQKALAPARFWCANLGDGLSSGLGLSIVQRIAKAHGGTLHIADRPGGDARVVLATQILEGGIVPGESRQPAAQQ